MIKKLLSRSSEDAKISVSETRRRHTRLEEEVSRIAVNGFDYNIKDWSKGGVYFDAPNQSFKIGDAVDLVLNFSLPHGHIQIPLSGRIARRTRSGYAVQFTPLTSETRAQFVRVLDAIVSRGFENSTIATYH